MPKRYFEDIIDNEQLQCDKVVFSKKDILEFARQFDPQPFHTDESVAEDSIFGGLVASSLHTLSACTRVIVEAQGDIAILSGVGMDEVKMYNPVRPGDILTVQAWWSDVRPLKSKAGQGLASIKCRVTNQHDDPVVEYGYRYLIRCREDTRPT